MSGGECSGRGPTACRGAAAGRSIRRVSVEPTATAPPAGTGRRRRRRPRRARRRPQHRDLLDRHRACAAIAGLVREIVAVELLRHERRVHRRSRSPSRSRTCVRSAVRRRRAQRRVRARSSPSCSSRARKEALPAGLDAVLPDPRRARRDHGRSSSSARRRDHAAFTGDDVLAAARRPDGRPQPRAVPDRRAARAQRPRRRDPQRLRPLHDPGDLAAGLERRDPRLPGRDASRSSTATTSSTRYAIGVLAGTVVQFAMALPRAAAALGFRLAGQLRLARPARPPGAAR